MNYRTSDEEYLLTILAHYCFGQVYYISINNTTIPELSEDDSLITCTNGSTQFVLAKDKKKKRKLSNSSGNWKQNGEEKQLKCAIPGDLKFPFSNIYCGSEEKPMLGDITQGLKFSKRTLTFQENGGNFKLWEYSILLHQDSNLGNELLFRHYLEDDASVKSSIKYSLGPIKVSISPIYKNNSFNGNNGSAPIIYPHNGQTIALGSISDLKSVFTEFLKSNASFKNRFEWSRRVTSTTRPLSVSPTTIETPQAYMIPYNIQVGNPANLYYQQNWNSSSANSSPINSPINSPSNSYNNSPTLFSHDTIIYNNNNFKKNNIKKNNIKSNSKIIYNNNELTNFHFNNNFSTNKITTSNFIPTQQESIGIECLSSLAMRKRSKLTSSTGSESSDNEIDDYDAFKINNSNFKYSCTTSIINEPKTSFNDTSKFNIGFLVNDKN